MTSQILHRKYCTANTARNRKFVDDVIIAFQRLASWMEVHVSNNVGLLDAMAEAEMLRECDRDSVFRLLFSGNALRFEDQAVLFTIPYAESWYLIDIADAYKCSGELHRRVREALYEPLEQWGHVLQRVFFFHPVHGQAYLEYAIEREVGKGSAYYFRVCALDGAETPLVEVDELLARNTILFLMASGMIQTYDIQVDCIKQ